MKRNLGEEAQAVLNAMHVAVKVEYGATTCEYFRCCCCCCDDEMKVKSILFWNDPRFKGFLYEEVNGFEKRINFTSK